MGTQDEDEILYISLSDAKQKVQDYTLGDDPYRCLYWMLFLGVVQGESSNWESQLLEGRQTYKELLELHQNSPSNEISTQGPVLDHPLAVHEDSSWSKFFENNQLLQVIELDLSRTHPTNGFFQIQTNLQMMRNILFLWSKLNPDVSYRQGMNEILSIILLQVSQSYSNPQIALSNRIQRIITASAVESDSYLLFEAVMRRMRPFYEHKAVPNPIAVVSDRIQQKLLKAFDKPLHDHLNDVGVEPQVYAM